MRQRDRPGSHRDAASVSLATSCFPHRVPEGSQLQLSLNQGGVCHDVNSPRVQGKVAASVFLFCLPMGTAVQNPGLSHGQSAPAVLPVSRAVSSAHVRVARVTPSFGCLLLR